MKQYESSCDPEKAISYKELRITSKAFDDGGTIPLRYTCDGENVSPPLRIEHIPKNAMSLLILAEDLDTPIRPWTHWLAWNIPVTHQIKENEIHGVQGLNDFQYTHYTGPCPASGTHRYVFKVSALDILVDLPFHIHKLRLQKEISGHVVAYGELAGVYTKKEMHFGDWVNECP